jgi:hypothetical protein
MMKIPKYILDKYLGLVSLKALKFCIKINMNFLLKIDKIE